MNQDKYSVEELPKVLKLCAKSNVFPLSISTMRHYGLLDGQKEIYCLTKLANRHISAASEDEKEQLAQVLLEEEFGLTNATIHIAAKVFIENSAELGSLKDGILDME